MIQQTFKDNPLIFADMQARQGQQTQQSEQVPSRDNLVQLAKEGKITHMGGKLPDFLSGLVQQAKDFSKKVIRGGDNTINIDNIDKQNTKLQSGTILGTNYDPHDPSQTRPNTNGVGAAGVVMTNDMIAVPRKLGTDQPILPYGTLVYFPKFDRNFLVADLKGPGSVPSFDFATPHTGSDISKEYNQDLEYKVVELGKGRADARSKAKDLNWKNLK